LDSCSGKRDLSFSVPVLIKAKYFVLILIVVTVAFAIRGGGTTAYSRTWAACSSVICT